MFVDIPVRRFVGPRSADDLTAFLKRKTEKTKIVKIEQELMVRLDKTGLLAGQFRLTRSAAREFGSRLARNFGAALIDLADNAESEDDYEYLAEAVNNLTRMNYRNFFRWRWVFDKDDKLAVGLIGPRYRVTSNYEFWAGVMRTCIAQSDKPRLFTALVNNRNLDVVMAGSDSVNIGSTTFFRGVLAQNAETSGRAVRAANVLISKEDGSWACDNFYADTRIPHLKGRKFDAKMSQIYERLRQRRVPDEELQKSWAKAADTRITKPELSVTENTDRITGFLRQKGLASKDAKSAAYAVISADKRPTVVNLFKVLSRRAHGRSDFHAIKCRQVAYSLCFLTNRK